MSQLEEDGLFREAWSVSEGTVRESPPGPDPLRKQLSLAAQLLAKVSTLPAEPALIYRQLGREMVEVRTIGGQLVVGRGEDCEIRFQGRREISRRHFKVSQVSGACHVEDLGSFNGTRVNERPPLERRHELIEGDLIHAGDVVFLFVRGD